jgi:hypothetical protein
MFARESSIFLDRFWSRLRAAVAGRDLILAPRHAVGALLQLRGANGAAR